MHPLIYDWNHEPGTARLKPRVMLDDETLRDGLQSPSVSAPTIDQKLRILHLMEELGIDTANIGLPGAGPHVVRDVERLAREIAAGMKIRANCAARTVIADIQPIAEISQRTGLAIECCTFIGSSPIRQYAEGWTLDDLKRRTEDAIRFAVGEGLPVMYVTEDTTRADPDTLRALYSTAIRVGASRLCVADTVGHATPAGAAAVVRFIAGVAADCGSDAGIDWHGHRDRDLAIANTIAAIDAGATRVHGAALGIGERVGNTPMDLLLVNLVLSGYIERDLSRLGEYARVVAESCCVEVPPNYPVLGRDAFRTATGVHAAAVIKAFRKKDAELADAVYSSIPAGMVGREQEIEIGPMSGRSNVLYWLEKRGMTASDELVDRIFTKAKDSSTVLTEAEILELCR
ncbi:MAG TPA: LeuA family protein [Vicinamibacterales bacterium]|nr:LeuA family protein [Vicinamibacterales bacterium]